MELQPAAHTGVGRWQRETVRALAAAVEVGRLSAVTAFALGLREPRPGWVPAAAGYRVGGLPGRIQRLLTDRLRVPVERVCGVGRPDLLLAMTLQPLPTRARLVAAVPDVSWRRFHGQYRRHFTPAQAAAAERLIRSADHVLTLSEHAAAELTAGGVAADRVTVAPLGVDDRFRAVTPADADRVRAAYRLPDRFVLHVGGINERKNLPVLAAAAARLSPPPAVILCGPPPADGLAFWNLDSPWVRHLGELPEADLPGLYAAATALVFPSKLEGFGLPLAEAMAVGCPVLAADTPVFREVAADAAAFFPPDDPARLADLIRAALDSADFRAEHAARGRARAAGFTWGRYAERLLAGLARAAGR